MCCGSKWKREQIPSHKFDFITVDRFTAHSCSMYMRFLWMVTLVVKSAVVLAFDIFTLVTMLTRHAYANELYEKCPGRGFNQGDCVPIAFTYGKWIFMLCIGLSFALYLHEAIKARKIIASRDISCAYTNVMACNYYSLRSYSHFCLFAYISDKGKKKDKVAQFVFFTFKGWKRIIFADAPRQVINAFTLLAFYRTRIDNGPFYDVAKYTDGSFTLGALIVSTLTTILLCAASALLLLTAAIIYVPLLCHIQGNLKEYCCHKVDKRIAAIIRGSDVSPTLTPTYPSLYQSSFRSTNALQYHTGTAQVRATTNLQHRNAGF